MAVLGVVGAAAIVGVGVYTSDAMKSSACGFSSEAERGRVRADSCKSCHEISSSTGELFAAGPNLLAVYGSTIGTRHLPGGRRNAALEAARDAGLTWTDANLEEYLKGPKAFLTRVTGKTFPPVNYMPYDIADPGPRRDVIAYLKFIRTRPDCT